MGIRMLPRTWGRCFVTLACAGLVVSPMLQQPLVAQQPLPVPAPAQNPRVQEASIPVAKPRQLPAGEKTQLRKRITGQNMPTAFDVALSEAGGLRGEVRDGQGKLLRNSDVVLWHGMQMIQRTRTDARGQFLFRDLRGGEYRIATPDVTIACRAWAAGIAPPNARKSLLIVANMYSERGQQPINEVFCFNPFLMGTIIAAAIAIPIAVHDSGDGELSDGS